ncbi:DUF6783 domain-containing protein [[Clostridium] symbiosum]|uniref:DUF6783 domain-containing protein n=1 Tax=Clostridium symbiosum TaxID=1512 RepID=UPI0034A48D0B
MSYSLFENSFLPSPAKCDAHLTESNFQPRSGERFGILMNDSIHGGNIFAGHGKL